MHSQWIAPHFPRKLIHLHEKISDAELLAVALLQKLHKVSYFSHWGRFLRLNHFPYFLSKPQARIRLARLTQVVKQLARWYFRSCLASTDIAAHKTKRCRCVVNYRQVAYDTVLDSVQDQLFDTRADGPTFPR
ncbi:hypothetical protein GCM10008955_39480 [Deinococcus malanensis]|uniref:Transposase n=1 Tax=Deinococcus malanensis TaxID=1706855 RepID=A0ABQ2F545_9DEIO|nr:hypothetical protein GCM10008955_39480 [Deinococcus malanensis]